MDRFSKVAALIGLSMFCSATFAAKAVDLNQQPSNFFRTMLIANSTLGSSATSIQEISRHTDFNNITHIRAKETFAGYPVWGSDVIAHVAHGAASGKSLNNLVLAEANTTKMDGIVYQDLARDLVNTPQYIFNKQQADKALAAAITQFEKQSGRKISATAPQTNLMVYVDDQHMAHWAFFVKFSVDAPAVNQLPAMPTFIIDAISFKTYLTWDSIETVSAVAAGGFGGNVKMGKLVYDGKQGDLAKLDTTRADMFGECFLANPMVVVNNSSKFIHTIIHFHCDQKSAEHDGVYWDDNLDAVNGGYSPANDALYAGKVIVAMYNDWYHVPVLVKQDGTPMQLIMNVHNPIGDNAFWNGMSMNFGDGVKLFYPLTSLGVAAHEISHGFTTQHGGFMSPGQARGMNESFSDMAAQAAEFYSTHTNSWKIGAEIFKDPDGALRYMDQPSKDCKGKQPGDSCSIDSADQYKEGMNEHYLAGVFNRAYYLIATTTGWDAHKAFDVMVKANQDYWKSNDTFASAACGVVKATRDYEIKDPSYKVTDVQAAFTQVKLDTSKCLA